MKNKIAIIAFALTGFVGTAFGMEMPQPELNQQLIEAVNSGNKELVEQLLKQGADVNTQDENGMAPLHHAILHDNLTIVKLLLEQETINVNIPNTQINGWTALHCAAYNDYCEILELLLNAQDNEKKSALDIAAQYASSHALNLLLKHTSIALSPELINELPTLHDEKSKTYFSLLPKDLITLLSNYKAAYTFSKEDAQKAITSTNWIQVKNEIKEALDKRNASKDE